MKEKLVELLQKADEKCNSERQCENCVGFGEGIECVNHLIADCLIDNGVTVPPCKVGDEVYCIIAKGGLAGGLIFTGHIIKRKVDKLIFDGKRWEMMSDRVYPDFKDGNGLIYAYFGDLVFVSEDEAKDRLEEILAVGDRRTRK